MDDKLIVRYETLEKPMELVRKGLRKLDVKNLRINLSKCFSAKDEIQRLGHKFLKGAMKPLNSKTSAIVDFKPTKKKKARIFSWISSSSKQIHTKPSQAIFPNHSTVEKKLY